MNNFNIKTQIKTQLLAISLFAIFSTGCQLQVEGLDDKNANEQTNPAVQTGNNTDRKSALENNEISSSDLLGTWKTDCQFREDLASYLVQILQFEVDGANMSTEYFLDDACNQLYTYEQTSFEFSLGKRFNTDNNLPASEIDVTDEFESKVFQIIALDTENNQLLIGKAEADLSLPKNRPTAFSENAFSRTEQDESDNVNNNDLEDDTEAPSANESNEDDFQSGEFDDNEFGGSSAAGTGSNSSDFDPNVDYDPNAYLNPESESFDQFEYDSQGYSGGAYDNASSSYYDAGTGE